MSAEKPVEEEKLVGKTVKMPIADTNSLVLRLGELAQDRGLATGDPCFCGANCGAVLSLSSVVTKDSKWQCEYCGHVTTVDLHEEERPKEEVLDYMLEPGNVQEVGERDESLVVVKEKKKMDFFPFFFQEKTKVLC